MVLMVFSACTKTIEIPRNEFEAASHDASASHRIRTNDGIEYVAEAFSVTDSTVVILRLAPPDYRYKEAGPLPIIVPLNNVQSVGRVKSNEAVPVVVALTIAAMIGFLHMAFGGW